MCLLSLTIQEENLCTHPIILTKKTRYRYIGYQQNTITPLVNQMQQIDVLTTLFHKG